MPPKKNKKRAENDWEAEALGETAEDASAATSHPEDANKLALPAHRKEDRFAEQADQDGESGDDGGDSGRVLTKAEKEKLKKEKEKERKKALAAKKKAQGDGAKAVVEKKEEAPAAAPAAAAAPSVAVKRGKKLPPHLAAIQKQQEELRRREEAAERFFSEEKARIEQEERLEAEEARRKEEAKVLKKQKEKEKMEQLKREGKFLTKAQKEEQKRNAVRLEQMKAAGVKIGALDSDDEGDAKKKTRTEGKKRSKKRMDDDKALAEAAERARAAAAATIKEAEEKARLDKDKAEAEAAAKKAAEAAASVDDDWEKAMSSDDEDKKECWGAYSDAGAGTGPANGTKTEAQGSGAHAETESSSDQERSAAQAAEEEKKRQAAKRREEARQAALAARSKENLRSPICCILGHVDTGKTKLLDKIRQTNVQEGEAGGITQQIGATFFPQEALLKKTAVVNKEEDFAIKLPGLLVIDTPGHESFSNMRQRGSSLCNIAILVVDIMHGLEPQTIESLQLLRKGKIPFVVALNKIDRLYGWNRIEDNGFQESLALQKKSVHNEFKNKLADTKVVFQEQGLNAELFYAMTEKERGKTVNLVPTSAHTGEGIPDLLKLICKLTQERLTQQLMYVSELEASVLETKVIEGLGTTIDVILVNGWLRAGDTILLCGWDGEKKVIKTTIRALLTPQPMRELRIKAAYVHHQEIKAAMGVKISAPGLEAALPGSRLEVLGPDDDEKELAHKVTSGLDDVLKRADKTNRGVSIQASTLGSLDAFLEECKGVKSQQNENPRPPIPVAQVGIGPIYKRDVIQCGAMLQKSPDHAVMLAYDVKMDKEAQAHADDIGVKVFSDDTIYRVIEQYWHYMDALMEKKKEEAKMLAVFPCVLNTVAVFNKMDPIVVGVDVVEGELRLNTPVAAVRGRDIIDLGRVTSIERDHKPVSVVKKGSPSVAVKIEMGGSQPAYGRQLDESDVLYSRISRASIDCLKHFYRDDLIRHKMLVVKLKSLLDIV